MHRNFQITGRILLNKDNQPCYISKRLSAKGKNLHFAKRQLDINVECLKGLVFKSLWDGGPRKPLQTTP